MWWITSTWVWKSVSLVDRRNVTRLEIRMTGLWHYNIGSVVVLALRIRYLAIVGRGRGFGQGRDPAWLILKWRERMFLPVLDPVPGLTCDSLGMVLGALLFGSKGGPYGNKLIVVR